MLLARRSQRPASLTAKFELQTTKTSFGASEPESVVVDEQVVLPELEGLDEVLTDIDRIIIIACGTASYSGLVGKYAIEKWARVPVEVELSHEFRYRDPVLSERTLVVSISQSGGW